MLYLWRIWSLSSELSSELEVKENPEQKEIIKNYCECLHPNRQFVLTTSGIDEPVRNYLQLGSSILQQKSARMGAPGSCRDNTPGTKRAPAKVSDCKMAVLRAAMKKSEDGSPDRHCKGVSKAGVLPSSDRNEEVSGPASSECQQVGRAPTRRRGHEGLRTGAMGPSNKVLRQ